MEKRFIIPAVTFLGGIAIWITVLLVIGTREFIMWQEVLTGFVTGGFIFFSGYRCRKVDGPRGGNVFRTIILLVLAILSYLFIGTVSAVILTVAAIATGILILGKVQPVQSKVG